MHVQARYEVEPQAPGMSGTQRTQSTTVVIQVFLDVDCRNLTYTSPVSPKVQTLAQLMEKKTKEKRKEAMLTPEQLVLHRSNRISTRLQEQLEQAGALLARFCAQAAKNTDIYNLECFKLNKDIPNNRSQTVEEALAGSLFSVISEDFSDLTLTELDEAFCRDIEVYSEAFEMEVG